MAKVLILSMDTVGEGLAFAMRCQGAGHAVRLYINPEGNQTIGTGFPGIERVKEWLTSVRWADIIWPTGNHDFLPKLDALRKAGKRVFGPSVKSAELEIKRQVGLKFLEEHGIECPTYKSVPTLAAAEAHVRKTGERFVFKNAGDEDDKSLSYCSRDAADLVAWLQITAKTHPNLRGPFILQEFIEGIEFAVSGWVGRDGYVGEFAENFERKKLMPGNYGPSTGEMGTVLKYVAASKLANEMLRPLEESLVKLGHLGDFDVNCIVDEKGKAWPLEITARPGWPSTNIQTSLHKGDPVQWMMDACEGKSTLQVSPRVAVGVVIAQPDFPCSKAQDPKETDGVPIWGVSDENRKALWPQAVKRVMLPVMRDGKVETAQNWATAGDYVLVVTGHGRTVEQAAERAYATVKQIKLSDMIVRVDLHKDLKEQLPKLHAQGYAREFAYDGSALADPVPLMLLKAG